MNDGEIEWETSQTPIDTDKFEIISKDLLYRVIEIAQILGTAKMAMPGIPDFIPQAMVTNFCDNECTPEMKAMKHCDNHKQAYETIFRVIKEFEARYK